MLLSASTASAETNASAEPGIARASRLRIYATLLSIAAVVVAADQATKAWALERLDGGRAIEVIEGVLTLRLTFNSGGAFGLGQGAPGLFLAATLVILVVIAVMAGRVDDARATVPLGLVMGGGLGNLADRVFRGTGGRVVDFVDLHVWPVFNLADSAIVAGVIVLLVLSLRSGK
jgi:signal peptidase II